MISFESAVQAWLSIGGQGSEVDEVIDLSPGNHKSTVLELRAGGEGTPSVVAKLAPDDTVALEAEVYTSILPKAGLNAVACFGTARSTKEGYSWLFLRKVDGAFLTVENPDHMRMITEWAATLHSATLGKSAETPLPVRNPSVYERRVAEEGQAVAHRLRDTVHHRDRGVLGDLVRIFDRLLGSWHGYGALLERLDAVLIHGDLSPENVLVSPTDSKGGALAVLDWEKAGIGPPAIDLVRLDLTRYALSRSLPLDSSGFEELRLQQALGRVLRTATRRLHRKPRRELKAYVRHLLQDLEYLGVS